MRNFKVQSEKLQKAKKIQAQVKDVLKQQGIRYGRIYTSNVRVKFYHITRGNSTVYNKLVTLLSEQDLHAYVVHGGYMLLGVPRTHSICITIK